MAIVQTPDEIERPLRPSGAVSAAASLLPPPPTASSSSTPAPRRPSVATAAPAAPSPTQAHSSISVAAGSTAQEVFELDDSDSDLEVLSQGYGPWSPDLPTDPRRAFYQVEIISLSLGSTDATKKADGSGAWVDEIGRPIEFGVELVLEIGTNKQFSSYRTAHQRDFDAFPVNPASSPAVALFTFPGKRPTLSVPHGQLQGVPHGWDFALDPGLRAGECVRIRVELISLRSRQSPLKAFDWIKGQLARASSDATLSSEARTKSKGLMPCGFVNVPVPVPTSRRPPESNVAPLFWAGKKIEPFHQWQMRFRWRCNTEEAWTAKKELEKEDS